MNAEFTSIHNTTPVVVYATNFKDWERLEMSLNSLRHFNQECIVYLLTICSPSPKYLDKVRRYGMVHIDVSDLFHSTFPFFRKHGKDYTILTPTGKKIALESFARLLVPLIPEIARHCVALFIDNDVVACGDIGVLFRQTYKRPITQVWSGISLSSMNPRIYRMYKMYDFFGISRPYTSSGLIMFRCDESALIEYGEFIQRVCDAETRIFENDRHFICEQDAISLYADYGRTEGKLCIDNFAKMGQISHDTVLYHYWPIKGRPDFMEKLRKHLVDGGKDVSWLVDSKEGEDKAVNGFL